MRAVTTDPVDHPARRAATHPDERVVEAVRAVDSISRALARAVEGPQALLEAIARAAAVHLDAGWALLGLGDGHLPLARPRSVVVGPAGLVVDASVVDPLVADPVVVERPVAAGGAVPADVREELEAVRTGTGTGAAGWTRVAMDLGGRQVGSLAVRQGPGVEPGLADLSVLRILANQAAVCLRTSHQHQRELRDAERHRAAHDSLSQCVLGIGMALEVARTDLAAMDGPTAELAQLLADARAMTGEAVEHLRRSMRDLQDDGG